MNGDPLPDKGGAFPIGKGSPFVHFRKRGRRISGFPGSLVRNPDQKRKKRLIAQSASGFYETARHTARASGACGARGLSKKAFDLKSVWKRPKEGALPLKIIRRSRRFPGNVGARGAKTPSGRLRRFRAQAAEAAAGPPRQFPPGLSENHPAGDEGGRMLSVPARDLFFRGRFLCAPACRRPLYWDPFKTRQLSCFYSATARWILIRRTDAQSAAVPIKISYFNGRVVLQKITARAARNQTKPV